MTDLFVRLERVLAGRYTIERELGQGGMAIVYLARDLRHRRHVALKVLSPDLAHALGPERFLLEIEIAAKLIHPHILPLFDSGVVDGLLFYAMPFVEGESVRQRLDRESQLPVDDALEIARQVAGALTFAHSQGIIHRDIKPENILLSGGEALVADFGIARAVTAAGGSRLTETGISLGTPAYMSPEQASAEQEIDGRSDQYSLACVVYEMLVGEPPFSGPSTQVITARKFSHQEASVSILRDSVPESVAEAIRKALAPVPADRYGTIGRFAEALRPTGSTAQRVDRRPATRRLREWGGKPLLWLGLGAAIALLATFAGRQWTDGRAAPRSSVVRMAVTLPAGIKMTRGPGHYSPSVALSPDGRTLVIAGTGPEGQRLYQRPLDRLQVTPIAGTEGASSPFFSPDGTWLGFFADGRIRRMPAAGGAAVDVAQIEEFLTGASWGPDDQIVFTYGINSPLSVVRAAGGDARQLISRNEGEPGHSHPEILPDGRTVLFQSGARIATGPRLMVKLRHEPTALPMAGTEGGTSPFFSPDGTWVGYLTADSKLRKVPAGGGGSITLAEGANFTYYAGVWLDDGTIVYAGSEGLRQIPAEGGTSRSIGKVGRQSPIAPIMISALPGSRAVLFTSCAGNCAISSDLYVHDMAADSARMLLHGVASAWYAPTGHIVYTSRDGGLYAVGFDARDLEVKPGAIPLIDGVEPASFTMSASGSALYSMMRAGASLAELVWVSRDGTVEPLAPGWQEVFDYPAVSPDGSSVAVSVRNGPTHLWIRRNNGTRQRLTSSGTMNWRPVWSPDGRSITYISSGGDGGNPDIPTVHRVPVDGSAPTRQVLAHDFGVWEAEVSKDEKWLIIRADEIGGDTNIRARRLDGDSALIPLLTGTDNTLLIALSPDARWLAFESNTSGRREVYVASFPDIASIHLVSSNGGAEPRWSRSGRELFFKSGGNLVAVDVPPGSAFTPGLPKLLFSVAPYRSARNRQQYDVSPDGRRFVMIRDLGGRAAEVIYVENWFTELAAKTKR